MVFGSNKRSKIMNFKIGSKAIEITNKYCYLGISIDKNGNFTSTLDELRKKALRPLFGLKITIIKEALSFDALLKLFDRLIKPILLYGCQVIAPNTTSGRKISQRISAHCSDPTESQTQLLIHDTDKPYFNIPYRPLFCRPL